MNLVYTIICFIFTKIILFTLYQRNYELVKYGKFLRINCIAKSIPLTRTLVDSSRLRSSSRKFHWFPWLPLTLNSCVKPRPGKYVSTRKLPIPLLLPHMWYWRLRQWVPSVNKDYVTVNESFLHNEITLFDNQTWSYVVKLDKSNFMRAHLLLFLFKFHF